MGRCAIFNRLRYKSRVFRRRKQMTLSMARLTALLAAAMLVAEVAAAQMTDVHVHVHAVPASAAYSVRAIPAHVIVPQARSFVADRTAQRI
jgi:hypothetical protein